MSRRKSHIPVFIKKKKYNNNEKEDFSPSLQVVFSIVDHSQFEI
jgi:DNA-binding XRE family transcriptional regulator